MGELSHREQVAAGGVYIEPPRLRFRLYAANRRQRAADGVDTEPGQGTRGSLRPIEKAAVWREVEIRSQRGALKTRWEGGDAGGAIQVMLVEEFAKFAGVLQEKRLWRGFPFASRTLSPTFIFSFKSLDS